VRFSSRGLAAARRASNSVKVPVVIPLGLLDSEPHLRNLLRQFGNATAGELEGGRILEREGGEVVDDVPSPPSLLLLLPLDVRPVLPPPAVPPPNPSIPPCRFDSTARANGASLPRASLVSSPTPSGKDVPPPPPPPPPVTTSQPLKLPPEGGGRCPTWHLHRRRPPPPREDDDALAPHHGQWHQQTRRRVERAGGRTAERNGQRIGRIRYGFMRDESMTTTNFPSKASFLFWK
jgi:hypothetical protein